METRAGGGGVTFTEIQTALLVWGLTIHMLADWFFQNHWMAQNKTSLRHPAAYVHAGIHGLLALLVFPWQWCVSLFFCHLLIDLRTPLTNWGKWVGQSTPEQAGAAYIPFAFGRDQAAHWLCIAWAAYWCGRGF